MSLDKISPRYETAGGDFLIHAYNRAEPFSSFLPGIAGVSGKPLWVFYTNRGQAISSFGIRNKDYAMLEFEPANKAYQRTALNGFRTFVEAKGSREIWEPFSPQSPHQGTQTMTVRPEEVILEETHSKLRLRAAVTFFTVPHEENPLLARIFSFTNHAKKDLSLRVTDGLAQVVPFGLSEWHTKHMSRTMEAFMQTLNAKERIPFYQVKMEPTDTSDIKRISGGFFALGSHKSELMDCLVDPRGVFGSDTTLVSPFGLLQPPEHVLSECTTPSAFFQKEIVVKAGKTESFFTLFGYAESLEKARVFAQAAAKNPAYAQTKREENQKLIREITRICSIQTADERLNAYHAQSFLDNVLRGGLPEVTESGSVLHLYTRKHGDMERDYNAFEIPCSFYSQGNGNFRDMHQNRRSELLLEPRIRETNLELFFNLIQLDGFNPLVMEPQGARHGEGFWIDHWTYGLDTLENYLMVWPEKLHWLLLEKTDFTFFDNDHLVQPRSKRYVLKEGKPRQLHAVVQDLEKKRLIASRADQQNCTRLDSGRGEIYRTTLAAKIVCLIANKICSLDPFGVGLEMEADKPGWCDALNGLPSLFGSSSNETLELKRLVDWFSSRLAECAGEGETLEIHQQIRWFFEQAVSTLAKHTGNWFATWDALNHAKESFRQNNRLGLSGKEIVAVRISEISDGLKVMAETLKESVARMKNSKEGIPVTYFAHEAKTTRQQQGVLEVQGFEQIPLPSYLEGPVHAMKLVSSVDEARRLRDAVRRTPLWDKALGMYRLNVPLDKESDEIGRAKIFTPGWLEDESIFLHMEYKWLLEELKSGLYPEFFEDLQTALIAYQDPRRYKRSPYENSSFLASSRFPDPSRHGQGFVARLSGATAEWVNMVFVMFLGPKPFRLSPEGEVIFKPEPVLPTDFFTLKPLNGAGPDSLSLRCLRNTLLIYENPSRQNTFGPGGVTPHSFTLQTPAGSSQTVPGSFLPTPEAEALREGRFSAVRILLK